MGDMDEWDCFKCGAYCSYRASSLCRTCEDKRLLFRNSMRLWFDENQIPWDEPNESKWNVTGKNRKCIVDLKANDIRATLGIRPGTALKSYSPNDGDVLIWMRLPGPYDGSVYKEGEDFIPKIIADLNYHDSEFFTKLKEAIDGR